MAASRLPDLAIGPHRVCAISTEQLRAARDRIAQLEYDVVAYRERAERAELWLDKTRAGIDHQFPTRGRDAPQ